MSTTPNCGFALPAHGSQNWDAPLNNNATIADGIIGGGAAGQVFISQGANHPGVWKTFQDPPEIPAGTINGTTGSDGNPTFTVANVPFSNFRLTKNGVEMYQGVAYTRVGNTITYLAPYIPITGDIHRATYIF